MDTLTAPHLVGQVGGPSARQRITLSETGSRIIRQALVLVADLVW